jgi:prevent-host-death family protein
MYNHYVHKKGYNMTIQTTSMASARANFAESLDAASNGEVILIQRRGKPDTAIIDADLLEDFLSSINPRIINKIKLAREESDYISFEDAFSGIL